MRFTKVLGAGVTALFMLAGCAQGGDDTTGIGPGNPGGGGGPTDLTNCSVPVGNLCVLGGDGHGSGLVEELLSPNGPLGPIAGAINSEDLVAALETLLQNDGDFAGLIEQLLINGQLQEGLTLLLLGDEDGNGGLADILQDLLLGTEQGGGLVELFGEDGMAGLLMALLVEPADPSCQVPLGTICLITGDGNQRGLINLLITEDGVLSAISDNFSEDELVAILANMLASDGSLANLAENLFLEGQLADGLQVLLLGDGEDPTSGGLIQAVEALLDPSLVDELLDFLGSLFGLGGETGTPLDGLLAALQGLADGGDGEGGDLPFGPDDLADLLNIEQIGALADLLDLLDPGQLGALADLLGGGEGDGPTGTPLDDLIALLGGLGGGDELPMGDLEELLDPEQLDALLDLAGLLQGLLDPLLDLLGGGLL